MDFLLRFAVATILLSCCITVRGLANCPPGCQCDDNTLVVHCGEGQLDVLPIALNPSIQRLVIKNNKIKIIDSSIQFYAELTFLDLSSNHLMTIPPRTFIYQKKLQELHLNHNKIGMITNKTLMGLSSLIILNLRGNEISELHEGTFSPLSQIEELNLGENRINFIHPNAFAGLNQLRILYLDDNALTTVPSSDLYLPIPSLAELFLGSNLFDSIPADAFASLKSLTRLELKSVGLKEIAAHGFKGLESMRVLDLSDNRLLHIPTAALRNLRRLEELFLGQNEFEFIMEGSFAGLNQLKRLDICGSLHLKKVMHDAFATNTNLEYLNLSSNKMLDEVQEGSLSGLPHLRHIILKSNSLKTLAEGLFSWKDLKTLDVSDNPIDCDCRVMWLRNLLLAKNATSDTVSNVLCESPKHLHGESLMSLSPALIGCSHSDPKKQALIGALLVGTAATITAVALIIYRCRRKIRAHLNGGLLGSSGLGRKEREYQKTFCDDDFMSRTQHHPCSLGIHSTFPHGYNTHHNASLHYGMCSSMTTDNRNILQQLKVSNATLINGNNQLKSTPTPIEDSAPFMMHMKSNHGSYQNLNHYTQPELAASSASAYNEPWYSYADVATAQSQSELKQFHQVSQHNFNASAQPQNDLHYDLSPNLNSNTKNKSNADVLDLKYIYSNAFYSTPFEHSTNLNAFPPSVSPKPPALPQRNGNSSTYAPNQRQNLETKTHNTLPNTH